MENYYINFRGEKLSPKFKKLVFDEGSNSELAGKVFTRQKGDENAQPVLLILYGISNLLACHAHVHIIASEASNFG
jgi:hypothetical protein